MQLPPLVIATLLVVLVVIVVALWVRGSAHAAHLQRQLGELGARLETLVAEQRDVPRVLAEGSAQQAKSLADVRERLAGLTETSRRLETLGENVIRVQELLRVPKLRGTLGEIWLEELLRQVFPAELYEMQHTFRSGETVDALLRIGGRAVPVDAKFPLEACQRMLAADGDEAERERRTFGRGLRQRIDEIADKYIRPDEGTYDFALMYIPAENVYYEAVVGEERRGDGGSLVAYALERRVLPVSPHTFYAYLAVVLHGLRGLEVERHARDILESVGGVRRQLERFARCHELMGRHLENAVKQYGESERHLAGLEERLERLTAVRGGGGEWRDAARHA